MPRRTRAESEATAASVLDAAVKLFAADGYADVRLDDVAASAGVTRGAVYHHYTDKRGLFIAALARTQSRVARAVGEAAIAAEEVADGPWEAFEAGCRAFLEAAARDDVRQIMLVDAPAVLGWNTWRDLDAQHSGRLLRDALAALADAGLIAPASRSALAAMLSGAMNEAALWVTEQADLDEALDLMWGDLAVLLRGCQQAGQ